MSRSRRVQLPNGCYAYEDTPNQAPILYQQILKYFDQGVKPQKGMTIFDVGAHIGLFALEALYRTDGQAKVFCFEPAPKAFDLMRRALTEQFPQAELEVLNVGLFSAPAEATFFYRPRASMMSSLDSGYILADEDLERLALTAASMDVPPEYMKQVPAWFAWLPGSIRGWLFRRQLQRVIADVVPVPCKLTTITHMIREYDLPRIDVLKIDAEGAEWDVLQGIGSDDWPKIQSVAIEVHDVDGRLEATRALFMRQGLTHIRVDQEDVYRGTAVFGVWATREAPR